MRVAPFYSTKKPKVEDKRVHHNNNQCPSGQIFDSVIESLAPAATDVQALSGLEQIN